jgi:hypothetical protein
VIEHQDGPRAADHPGPVRRLAPPSHGPDQTPAELLGGHRLPAGRGRGASSTLIGQLQRAVGNAAVQRMLAGYHVSRQAETGEGAGAAGPVVDDSAEPAPGQMRRTEFLTALRAEVEGVLTSAGPLGQADARTHLPAAFADLVRLDTVGLTRSLQQNLPGVEGADARRYISAAGVATRARVAGDVVAAPVGAVGRVLSAVGGLVSALFKARDGVATPKDARVVRSRLGTGQPLDVGVRAPMESVYGQDFSDVRVHADAGAGAMSDGLGARAFTVGRDIAFSPGEYQPGSLVGNALIAHELAHVGQQGGDGSSSVAALEEDADRAAVGAVVAREVGATEGQIEGYLPRLRAGLRLQRCAGGGTQVRPPGPGGASSSQACTTLTTDQWRTAVEAARALTGDQRAAAMTRLAQQAVCELGISVQAARTSHENEVHPDDYAPIPVLNFDAGLNGKTRWRTSRTQDPAPIGDNAGYNFRAGDRRFAIIGPNALKPDTWLTTRQYAQHELALVVAAQPAGRTSGDLELQTWTEDFRGYFHQYLALPIPKRPNWQALIGYYERAAPDVREQSLRRLVDYYNNPPVSGEEADRVRRQLKSWMRRMNGTLITDLNAALPATPR